MSKKSQKQIDRVIREIDKLVDMPGKYISGVDVPGYDIHIEEWATIVSLANQLRDVRTAMLERDIAGIEFGEGSSDD